MVVEEVGQVAPLVQGEGEVEGVGLQGEVGEEGELVLHWEQEGVEEVEGEGLRHQTVMVVREEEHRQVGEAGLTHLLLPPELTPLLSAAPLEII